MFLRFFGLGVLALEVDPCLVAAVAERSLHAQAAQFQSVEARCCFTLGLQRFDTADLDGELTQARRDRTEITRQHARPIYRAMRGWLYPYVLR